MTNVVLLSIIVAIIAWCAWKAGEEGLDKKTLEIYRDAERAARDRAAQMEKDGRTALIWGRNVWSSRHPYFPKGK